jgi:hypothetical protein
VNPNHVSIFAWQVFMHLSSEGSEVPDRRWSGSFPIVAGIAFRETVK